MKLALTAGLLIIWSMASQPGAATSTKMAIPRGKDIPTNLRPYVVAILVRGPKTEDVGADLQAQHLAYIHQQIDAGNYALAGPFTENANERGIIVLNTTKEEAERLLSEDPVIKAGLRAANLHSALLPDFGRVVKY
jgi:uncharacterized protein YciI